MKNKIIIWSCAACLAFASCEEKVVHKYESENSVYFYRGAELYNTFVQYDSLIYNFVEKKSDRLRDTVRVRVRTAGFLSDRDREVQLVQINHGDSLAAVAGKHYIGFDDPEMAGRLLIPAGSIQADLPVVLLRDASLRSREMRIEIELRENGHFKIVMPDLSRFVIKFTDMIARPANWETSWRPYLGEWGPEKMRFLVEYVGVADFEGQHGASDMLYYRSKAIEKLIEYNNTHATPLTEADGTLVSFAQI
jgi:hypothetical protein